MAVTIRQVALEAGVSVGAVSKVLHGGGTSIRVGIESALRIRETAARLNYVPNAVARNLRSSRTHTIGVIFENLTEFADGPLYSMYLLDGLAKAVFPLHFRVSLLPELDRADVLGCLADGQIEGVIWCKLARDEETLRLIHECPIPIVALNAGRPEIASEAAFVGCDNAGGMALAVDHLVGLGHTKIAFLCEELERQAPDCEARREGYRTQLAQYGHSEIELVWSWQLDEFASWWASKPEATAIVCWSERCAGVLLGRARDAGVTVPADLSVVGFDSTPYCEILTPRLTSVRQPIREMAQLAGEILISRIRGNVPAPSPVVMPCGFDVRNSTGVPRES